MRILGIGGEAQPGDFSAVHGFYAVHAYFVQAELKAQTDFTIAGRLEGIAVEQFDHVIGFGLRRFDRKYPRLVIRNVRKRIKGAVAQFEDSPRQTSEADLNFVCKDSIPPRGKSFTPYCVTGWAADSQICQSRQSNEAFRILLDHPDYEPTRMDLTKEILQDIDGLKKSRLWRGKYGDVVVDVLTTPRGGDKMVTFDQICKKYEKAHVFIVTHAESVGLSVIEAATSGALVIAPNEFIDHTLLRTVRHVRYRGKIPWDVVMKEINPHASRELAVKQSWSALTNRMLVALRKFRK